MSTQDNKLQAHKLTHQQIKDLQEKQIHSLEIEKIKGNVDKDYELNAHEAHLIHVQLETPEFNQSTGEKTSRPFNQMFTVEDFKKMEAVAGFAQYKVRYLHDPTKGTALKDLKRDHIGSDPSNPNSLANVPTPESEPVMWRYGNRTELQAKYLEIFGVEADIKLTKAEMVDEIQIRLDNPPTTDETGEKGIEEQEFE